MTETDKKRSELISAIARAEDQLQEYEDRDDYGPKSRKLAMAIKAMKADLAALPA